MQPEVIAALLSTPTALIAAGAAYAAGRIQARGAHQGAVDAIRRKDQRDTYAELPRHVRKFLLALPPVLHVDSVDRDAAVQRLMASWVEIQDAAVLVELEGPKHVADLADQVVVMACDLLRAEIDRMIGRSEGRSLRSEWELLRAPNEFAAAASVALNGGDLASITAREPVHVTFEPPRPSSGGAGA